MQTTYLNSSPVPKGVLLIIGGHENKGEEPENEGSTAENKEMEILREFVKLAGGERAGIEVITSGSSEGDESFSDYKKAFGKIGVENVGHIHHNKRGEVLADVDVLQRIKKAAGIYFAGGDQLKLTSVYGGTQLLFQLKQRYVYDNVVIAGTSAGAMAMSTPMIYAGNKSKQQIAGEVKITTGLEFLKDACIDTHFVDRSRFVRMAQVITTNPTCIGMGIEEDTAVVVSNGIECKVIGSGIVIIIEGFGITDSNILNYGKNERISVSDLQVKLLSHNSIYKIPQNNSRHI